MEKRGWKDNFTLRVNDPYEKLKDLNVPKDIVIPKYLNVPETNGNRKGKGKEKARPHQRSRSSFSSVEHNTLADGGVYL
jgi:hypothetical protein